ncbi:MAG: NADH-quinone oxidoreductase subunit L [Thermodesulfobacteriota bacterium]
MDTNLIFLIILFPLLGAIVNGLLFTTGLWRSFIGGGKEDEKRLVSLVGSGVILVSAVLSSYLFFKLLGNEPSNRELIQHLFVWIPSGDLSVSFEFLFDPLSSVMALVVTWISFFIHVYSIGYMHEDRDYSKYFTYLNMFVFFMLLLILGNNFALMFVGWEGVGLASYLLIGFWYEDTGKAYAGRKAFIVNRIGDLGFILGIFLIFFIFGSLNYQEVFSRAADPIFMSSVSGAVITGICLLLFVGAIGKSAQLPLYVWLPDAMAGPTPVSALIHAATMVTAGAYMMARYSVFYSQSPTAQFVVVSIAAITSLLAATIAMSQTDIKKVLAYSTVSQLGYMFMAIGVGAYAAGIFHLVTHAFFKALLFLGSGSVIHALSGVQDIRGMGGLRKFIPLTSITFLIGTLAIAGVPFLSGFFSKDEILASIYENGYLIHWIIALVTVILTAFYMLRLYILTFEGKTRIPLFDRSYIHESPLTMTLPLIILAVLSIFGGYIGVPQFMGEILGIHNSSIFKEYLLPSLYLSQEHYGAHHLFGHWTLVGFSIFAALIGILAAFYMYYLNTSLPGMLTKINILNSLYKYSLGKWFVDEFYDALIVKPFNKLSADLSLFDSEIIDGALDGISIRVKSTGAFIQSLQSGMLRLYATLMVIGAIAIVIFVVVIGMIR